MGGNFAYNSTISSPLNMYNSYCYGDHVNASSSIGSGGSNNGILDNVNQPKFKVDKNGNLVVSKAKRKKFEERRIKGIENENKKARTNLAMSLGAGSLFMGGTIINGLKFKTNAPVTEMVLNGANTELWKKAPGVTIEAQEELAKFNRDFQKQYNRYIKNGSDTTQLVASYEEICNKFKTPMANGNADEVAKLTHQLKDTKGMWQRMKLWGSAPKIEDRLAKMATVDASKITAKTGNSFLKNCGGGAGLKLGIGMGALTMLMDSKKIYTAFEEHGFGTGMTQLGQSALTALVPATVYTLSDGLGKTLVNKAVSKGAGKLASSIAGNGVTKLGQWFAKQGTKKIIGKLCTKVATKLTGKAIGAAIGSIIPGAGTVLGFAIGCVADWAIQKYLMPHSDITDEKETEKKSTTELVYEIHQDKQNGVNIDEKYGEGTEKLYKKYEAYCLEIDKQQAQQAQLA